MCNVCLRSSRLPTSTSLIDASLSVAVPTASRLSSAKLWTSPMAALRSSTARPTFCWIVGHQRCHRSHVPVELLEQVRAVVQRGDQSRQVLERGEDVVAVITQSRQRLRELDHDVADVGALPAQVVGGGVDERAQRADTARFGRLQQFCQPLQLDSDVIPFHWNRGTFLRDDGARGHGRSTCVGGRQLDRPTRHQLWGQYHRLGGCGNSVLAVHPERDLGAGGLGLDAVHPADRHAEDANVVAGEQAVAVLEIRCHPSLPEPDQA